MLLHCLTYYAVPYNPCLRLHTARIMTDWIVLNFSLHGVLSVGVHGSGVLTVQQHRDEKAAGG